VNYSSELIYYKKVAMARPQYAQYANKPLDM